uniref:Spatacsin C-terminal domain-containing protein n=1 Tax=Electrophorus electricus TaxID=8005 RepID=A0A4W4GX58_ELEEL
MLRIPEPRLQSALEVALLPDNDLCKDVDKTVKAKMAKGCSLLCCLNVGGKLSVSDISERGAPMHVLEDTYADLYASVLFIASVEFCLLFALSYMKSSTGVSELTCVRLLSFTDARCSLLLSTSVLVQLLWQQGPAQPETLSSCLLNLPSAIEGTFTDYQLSKGTLFVLTTAGFIYVFDSVEGKHLASVDLQAYHTTIQREVEPTVSLSSFCLLNISQDLSTAVVATSQNQALAIDLNDYFRTHPTQLLCRQVPNYPPLIPAKPCDQDSLLSSAYSQSVLDAHFQTDHSWEARLAVLYKQAKAPNPSMLQLSWYRDFPNSECHQAVATAKPQPPSIPAGGAVMSFTVPEQTTPTMLNVSEFSAVLAFTSADNSNTTLAYWDLESQCVVYHSVDAPAVLVHWSEEEHLCFILKASGLSLVLFAVSQEELLNRLMVFGSAGMVDSLCHLNTWGRCSMPIQALQAGLKNRQLDMVDFFLKSKENILCPPTGYSVHEQSPAISTQTQLKNAQDLCPAMDLLYSAIRDTNTEAQSRQFCEQLLSITLNFLNRQIRVLLSSTPELDANLQACVRILEGYISKLRTYMRKYPWLEVGGSQIPALATNTAPGTTTEVEWESLSVEEVVQHAVLSKEIPHAQACLRRRGCPEQNLEELRRTGLKLAFTCLKDKDLLQATTLLTNMGFNVKQQLHNICVYTADQDLRTFMVDELKRQNHLSAEEMEKIEFIKQIENLGSAKRCLKPIDKNKVLHISQSDAESRKLIQEMVNGPSPPSFHSLLGSVCLDWVRHWDNDTQKSVVLSRLPDSLLASCDPAVLWSYLTSLHDQDRISAWLTSMAAQGSGLTAAPMWPPLTAAIVDEHTHCSGYIRDQILDMLARLEQADESEWPSVELLILAHDCFSLTCNMEGIVKVLQAARHLSHTHLAHKDGYGLLVRLLTGIGRYNEMTYIFDLLNQNHHFEILLRKKQESNTRLKTALLDYIKRCLPGDSEKHNMVALCFSMRREIGENHEGAARTQLKLIESQPWAVTPELKSSLEKVLSLLKDAAESYSKDSCMRQALRCVKMAKLVVLQLHFLTRGHDDRVVNLQPSELPIIIVALPHCYQSFVVAEAYDYSPDWAEVLYQKVILRGDFSYLEEFKLHRPLPTSLFEEISKKLSLNKPPNNASQNLKRLLQCCEDVYTHYKLAYEHKFIDVVNMLLQDSKTNSYLNDRLSS